MKWRVFTISFNSLSNFLQKLIDFTIIFYFIIKRSLKSKILFDVLRVLYICCLALTKNATNRQAFFFPTIYQSMQTS